MATAEHRLLVIDTSVLVELVVDGRHRAGADELLQRYAESAGITLVTAAHGLIEAISAVRRLTQRGILAPTDGEMAAMSLRSFDLVLDATASRVGRIWALREQMSAYDGAYAACSEAFGGPLVTVDARLNRACAAAGIDAIMLDDVADVLN